MKSQLSLNKLLIWIVPVVIGVLQELVSQWLVESRLLSIFLSAAVVLVIVAAVLKLRERAEASAVLHQTRTILTAEDRSQYAREGLIVFISLYTPGGHNRNLSSTSEQRIQAAAQRDYEFLDLENSNLKMAIEAVMTHASRLKHCWLVSTVGRDGISGGSFPYVPALVQYLQEVKGLGCQFHYQGFTITQDVDSEIVVKTRDVLNRIFQEAQDPGRGILIEPKHLITDITGGFRSITLGAFLACLDGSRDLQFIGTRYNQMGKFEGPLFPMLFDFEPRINPS